VHKAVDYLITGAIFAVLWIGFTIDNHRQRRRCPPALVWMPRQPKPPRCEVSSEDAGWLRLALDEHCPVCSRPLADHGRP